MLKALILRIYPEVDLIFKKHFLNVANEENFTMLGGDCSKLLRHVR